MRKAISIVIGIVGIIAGLGIAFFLNQPIHFTEQKQGIVNRLITETGSRSSDKDTAYMLFGSEIYYFYPEDFSPNVPVPYYIASDSDLTKGSEISFIYTKDETMQVDVTPEGSSNTLKGTGYKVVQITMFNEDETKDYVTEEYQEHPNGYNKDYMIPGLITAGVAAIVLLYGIFAKNRPPHTNGFNIGNPQGNGFNIGNPQGNGFNNGNPQQPFQNPNPYQSGPPQQSSYGNGYNFQAPQQPYPPQVPPAPPHQ